MGERAVEEREQASRPLDASDPWVLAPAWDAWVVHNLARRVAPSAVVQGLVAEGVPAEFARNHVEARARAPVLRACGRNEVPVVVRGPYPGTATLLARYWDESTPASFSDFMACWPALRRWSPAYLAQRVGEVPVEVALGREGALDPDVNFARHHRTLPLREYVRLVEAAGTTNDLYMIGRGRNLARRGMEILLEDIVQPEDLLDASRAAATGALWFGPAGTVTPLHHDTCNILFCQIVGRKEFRLVPPGSPGMWTLARGLYSHLDPLSDEERFLEVGGQLVEAGPGDTLFLPAGWWHHVRSLDVSISLALNNFVRPNDFEWYKPGVAP